MSTNLFSKYGRVFDLLPEIIMIVDADGQLIDYNKNASEALGFGVDGQAPKHLFEIVSNGDSDFFLEQLQREERGKIFETHFQKSDSTSIDVSVEIKELKSNEGVHFVIIANDITEQKRKELEYLQFSNVIHYTINPIQITDAKGIMVYVNPAFEKASGYSKEELIGKNPRLLSSGKHSKEFWKNVWDQIQSKKTWVGELENKRKNDLPIHVELLISPIEDRDGKVVGFLGAHRDITEQKLLQKQLIRSQKMESIGILAAGIAHEVGNPLTSISSLVQLLQRTPIDEDTAAKLELIKNQITRIAKIIRDLVDFSRPSSYVIKPTDVNAVIREALSIVKYGKKVKEIDFDVKLSSDLPLLKLVQDQLSQVFINILINAVGAIDGKKGLISIKSERLESEVVFTISDTGKGIKEEDKEKIFDPFYTTKEIGKGSGLGLWVSYGIVKNFDGDITVESKEGEGSTFTITLPVTGE